MFELIMRSMFSVKIFTVYCAYAIQVNELYRLWDLSLRVNIFQIAYRLQYFAIYVNEVY